MSEDRFESMEDYVIKSLTFLNESFNTILAERKALKAGLEVLKEDIRNIKSDKLLAAATNAFNHESLRYSDLGGKIKAIREDQKWTKEIWKALRVRKDGKV